MENRLKFISNLSDFIKKHSQDVQSFCNELGWNVQQTSQKSKSLSECPLDPSHLVAHSELDNHILRCQLNQQGYSKDDVLFPPDCDNGRPTVTLNAMDQVTIIQVAAAADPSITTVSLASAPEVPQSSSRLLTSLTTRQRLALYEHAIKETTNDSIPAFRYTELDLSYENREAQSVGEKSMLDIQREQRDAKRRRLNYRQAKKVHTQHKSLMEVTKEVIDNQMEMYMEWLKENDLTTPRSENLSSMPSSSTSQHERYSSEKDRKKDEVTEIRNSDHYHEKSRSSKYENYEKTKTERTRRDEYSREKRDSYDGHKYRAVGDEHLSYDKPKYPAHKRHVEREIEKPSSYSRLKYPEHTKYNAYKKEKHYQYDSSKYPEHSRLDRDKHDWSKNEDSDCSSRHHDMVDSNHKYERRRCSKDSKYEVGDHRYPEEDDTRRHTERRHKLDSQKHSKKRKHCSPSSERSRSRK